jgi:transposase
MEDPTIKPRRKRREFTREFKAGAVQRVLEEGKCAADVARDLDLSHSVLRRWVRRALADAARGSKGRVAATEKEEIARLRKENRELRMEREILRQAAVLLANPNR